MVVALPRPIELKLRQALAQWRQWDCEPALPAAPVPVKLLSGGLSNFTVLVEAGQRLVVRIDGSHPAAHGISRQGEWRAQLSAYKAQLAPRPCYFNPELGILVCHYLAPEPQRGEAVENLARLLRGIHRLPARHHRLDLAERILHYEKKLEHSGEPALAELAPYRESISRLLAAMQRRQQHTVLCHNDLLQANRIYSAGRLWAIDWEYCAMGSPWYELAVVVTGDDLSVEQSRSLLEAYLERPPGEVDFQRLQQYSCIYRYLELLWYRVPAKPLPDPALLRHKAVQLEQALRQLGELAHTSVPRHS